MKNKESDSLSVSAFKATCLAVLERVRRTGRPVLVTKYGKPLAEVVPPSLHGGASNWIGSMRDTARIRGDIVRPASDPEDWEALGN
ncbi:MAG: type II toxin-antitoxin system Phd/YefM family antitoxin [Gemmatimonadota bacterium]|nr:type II toxin-antitoxin system Phd/YefM family antitoxin [Gemmatimonadota bacterium]